jgi:hypothetical protein
MKALLDLRLAKMNDFIFYSKQTPERKNGMLWFVINSEGKLECYEIGTHTSNDDLKKFIKEDRCFVAAGRGADGCELVNDATSITVTSKK